MNININESFTIGLEGIRSHKLRSLLTMLGIIFGVGAVIAMLSIGEGAKQEALEQISQLGISNIIIQDFQIKDPDKTKEGSNFSRGLSMEDAEAVFAICPLVEQVVPQKEISTPITFGSEKSNGMAIGVTPEYINIMNDYVKEGTFFDYDHMKNSARVCVLGSGVKRELFYFQNAVGKKIKLGTIWFTVIGVMEDKTVNTSGGSTIRIRDLNQDVYIPLTTALKRFSRQKLSSEIDQITAKVVDPVRIREAANIVKGIVKKRHYSVEDFQIVIPEELLKQSQRTQKIFNIVMGAIAGISLLVGGIGIMNIMLATVLERTREIGIRRAVGATRNDILGQFIIEALLLSVVGGLMGIVLGFLMTKIITYYASWKTIVSIYSVFLAFGVSASIGMIFGIYPAKKASGLDPIESLRYE